MLASMIRDPRDNIIFQVPARATLVAPETGWVRADLLAGRIAIDEVLLIQ